MAAAFLGAALATTFFKAAFLAAVFFVAFFIGVSFLVADLTGAFFAAVWWTADLAAGLVEAHFLRRARGYCRCLHRRLLHRRAFSTTAAFLAAGLLNELAVPLLVDALAAGFFAASPAFSSVAFSGSGIIGGRRRFLHRRTPH